MVKNYLKRGYATAQNRLIKAKKIESVLSHDLAKPLKNFKILDIGTGCGEIASYLASLGNDVTSIDIVDQRTSKEGFKFIQVRDENLPFKDEQFDLIISSYIFEHTANQKLHIKEMERVLKKGGICYFSCPNRSFPIEAHTKWIFLHWLPRKFIFKLLKKEEIYLLSYTKTRKMLKNHFKIKEVTAELLKYPKKYFLDSRVGKVTRYLPLWLLQIAIPLSPGNIYILSKKKKI